MEITGEMYRDTARQPTIILNSLKSTFVPDNLPLACSRPAPYYCVMTPVVSIIAEEPEGSENL